MKKIIRIFLILTLVATLIAGCTNENENIEDTDKEDNTEEVEEEKVELPSSISDYFPFKENTIFSYKGEGNEYAEKKTYFEISYSL